MLLAVTACSATQFIYNRVDILVRWYLGDYVSLDRDQRARFDQRLEVFLEWHRSEELPSYVVLLDESLTILDDGVEAKIRSMQRQRKKQRCRHSLSVRGLVRIYRN